MLQSSSYRSLQQTHIELEALDNWVDSICIHSSFLPRTSKPSPPCISSKHYSPSFSWQPPPPPLLLRGGLTSVVHARKTTIAMAEPIVAIKSARWEHVAQKGTTQGRHARKIHSVRGEENAATVFANWAAVGWMGRAMRTRIAMGGATIMQGNVRSRRARRMGSVAASKMGDGNMMSWDRLVE